MKPTALAGEAGSAGRAAADLEAGGAQPATSLRSSVAEGVRWGALNQAIQQATRLGVQVVLTRLLAPESFGLVALAFVVVNFGSLLTGLGFSQALIQRRELRRDLIDAVFVGSGLLGAALAIAVAVAAPALSAMLGDPALTPVLRALSIVFLFQGIEGVPNTMLRRRLLFRSYVMSSTIAAVIGGAVGIGMGIAGAGVWALVGFALTESIVATSLAWVFAVRAGVWRPHLTVDVRPLRGVLAYSGAVTGNRLLFYGSRNVDNLIVGRVLGASALGVYGLAYRVMLFPIQRVTDVIGSVTLPTFAAMQDDRARTAAAYLRAVRYLAAVVVPVTVGVAVTAHHLVPVVFGPQWAGAVEPLRILALSGPAIALVRLTGNLWEATGRAGLTLAMGAVALAVLIPGFVLGVRYGVMGVAIAYTLTVYASMAPAALALKKTSGIPLLRQLRAVAPVLVAALALAGAAVAADALLPVGTGRLTSLGAMVLAGAIAYGATLHLFARGFLAEAVGLLRLRGNP